MFVYMHPKIFQTADSSLFFLLEKCIIFTEFSLYMKALSKSTAAIKINETRSILTTELKISNILFKCRSLNQKGWVFIFTKKVKLSVVSE